MTKFPGNHPWENENFPILKNDLLLRVARGEVDAESQGRRPVWIMRQAGRYLPEFRKVREQYDFFHLCRTPELACEITLQPIERYGELLDGAIIFSDILVIPQALGMQVEMRAGVGPWFPQPLRNPEDVDKMLLKLDDKPVDSLKYVFDAIRLTRKRLDGRVPLLGFAGAPWTLFAYMVEGGGGMSSKGFTKAKQWLLNYPEKSKQVLNLLADTAAEFLAQQVLAGAQMLQLFDSWAGELAPFMFHEFALPAILRTVDRLRVRLAELIPQEQHIPVGLFAKGASKFLSKKDYESCCSSNRFHVLALDWAVEPTSMVSSLSGVNVTLQGNLDPVCLYASNERIKELVHENMSKFKGKPHIVNLGHGMLPDHDPEKLKVFLEAVKQFQ